MQYRFATARESYEDLAAGRVLYARPGATAFPVRLASEIFQRCVERVQARGGQPPLTLYDPCCGTGYLLTVIGLLHGDRLARIAGSDVHPEAVALAERNLSLLTLEGLDRRIGELRALLEAHGKDSHREALASAERLRVTVAPRQVVDTVTFTANALTGEGLVGLAPVVDIVITDVPYGRVSSWDGDVSPETAPCRLLENLRPVLARHAVVALVADRRTRLHHSAYRPLETLTVGHRRARLLEPLPAP